MNTEEYFKVNQGSLEPGGNGGDGGVGGVGGMAVVPAKKILERFEWTNNKQNEK